MNTKNSIDKVFDMFSKELKNLDLSKDEIIEGENIIFHMTTTENQDFYLENDIYNNI